MSNKYAIIHKPKERLPGPREVAASYSRKRFLFLSLPSLDTACRTNGHGLDDLRFGVRIPVVLGISFPPRHPCIIGIHQALCPKVTEDYLSGGKKAGARK
jgi:hypothetical protein